MQIPELKFGKGCKLKEKTDLSEKKSQKRSLMNSTHSLSKKGLK